MIKTRMNVLVSLAIGSLLALPLSAQEPSASAAANVTTRSSPARDTREPSPDQCVLIDIHLQLPHGLWSPPGADVQSSADDEPRCMSAREQRLRVRGERVFSPERRS